LSILRERRVAWASAVAAAMIVVVGLGATLAEARSWSSAAASRARATAQRTEQLIEASAHEALQRDLDFDGVTRAVLAMQPDATNRALAAWYDKLNANQHYPGAIALAYVERVTTEQLPSYRAQVAADPVGGQALPDDIFPAGATSPHCFVRLEVQEIQGTSVGQLLVFPPGLDLCAVLGPTFRSAAQSAGVVAISGASMVDALLPYYAQFPEPLRSRMLSHSVEIASLVDQVTFTVTPVFPGGPLPGDGAARLARVTGWTLSAFQLGAVTRQAIAAAPDGGWSATLSLDAAGSTRTFASSGPTGARAFRQTFAVGTPAVPWQLTVAELRPAGSAGEPFWALLGAGVAVTLLVAALIVVQGTSRSRALALVDERTGQLRHQALHDALTDLPNRLLVHQRADELLQASGADRVVTALFVDLDNFKNINDSLGHAAGDEFIRAVAGRLVAAQSADGVVGAERGDEFVVLAHEPVGSDPERLARATPTDALTR